MDDEKGKYIIKEEDGDQVGDVFAEARLIDLGEDGKERPIGKSLSILDARQEHMHQCHADTDVDYAMRLVSLEDDPTLPIYTFRMWFLALGLSCFGAVLGQIFVGASVPCLNYLLIYANSISVLKRQVRRFPNIP